MKPPKLRQFPGSRSAPAKSALAPVRPVPGWRLPSGQLLVEYALRAGFVSSPLLLRWPLVTPDAAEIDFGLTSLGKLESGVAGRGTVAVSKGRRSASNLALTEER
jgi:hypothetical protein